jgi:hypothetical protein
LLATGCASGPQESSEEESMSLAAKAAARIIDGMKCSRTKAIS